MNSIAASDMPCPVLDKRFVSSVILGMVFVLIALLFVTVTMGSEDSGFNVSGLLVLAWPMSMFVLSLPDAEAKAKKSDRLAFGDRSPASSAGPGKLAAGEFFPPWLGSMAYDTAIADADERY